MVPNQYIIRATAGGGKKGDVAIDDVSVVDGVCEHITRQGMSYHMYSISSSFVEAFGVSLFGQSICLQIFDRIELLIHMFVQLFWFASVVFFVVCCFVCLSTFTT